MTDTRVPDPRDLLSPIVIAFDPATGAYSGVVPTDVLIDIVRRHVRRAFADYERNLASTVRSYCHGEFQAQVARLATAAIVGGFYPMAGDVIDGAHLGDRLGPSPTPPETDQTPGSSR